MLLFIQRETEVICSEVPVSIHLMLLFIEVSGVGSAVVEAFQYISCYSLSNCKEYRLYKQKGFNTSHVTLYLKSFIRHFTRSFWFQYISCYSLSVGSSFSNLSISCFNTSHVTLYQSFDRCPCFCCCRFNTSHVTLYR